MTTLVETPAKRDFFSPIGSTSGPRALHDLTRRLVLKESLGALTARGIPVMPLKGALLAYWVYDDPTERRVSDVDLLVPEAAFEGAVSALAACGYRAEPPLYSHERTLRASEVPLPIDLHRSVFARGRYRLPTKELFARGREATWLEGARVVLPDPMDVVAHLVGHAACNHQSPIDARTARDLERLAARFALDARECAGRLEGAGLARAARFTLGSLGSDARFAHDVLALLRRDPMGDWLSHAQRHVARRFDEESLIAKVAGHLTNSSLPRAAVAVAGAIAERICHRQAWRKQTSDI